MSNFLSQIEISPQVDEDDADIEREDMEREKEIKDFLVNELDDDDLFDDESSFTSHQTPLHQLDSPAESFSEFQEMPIHQTSPPSQTKVLPPPLLTSRGSNFLKKTSSTRQTDSVASRDDQVDNTEDCGLHSNTDQFTADHQHRTSDHGNQDTKQNRPEWEYENHHPQDSFHQHFSADRDNNSFGNAYEREMPRRQEYNPMQQDMQQDYSRYSSENPEGGGSFSNRHTKFPDHQNKSPLSDSRIGHASMFPFEGGADYNPKPSYKRVYKDQNDNSLTSNENAQLRILYDARGRKLEDLGQLLKKTNEGKDKEIRILQHKLTLLTGERDGINASYEQAMGLLREAKNETEECKRSIADEKEINRKLKSSNSELLEKLELSESTIESLSQQLTALNQTESLHKMRSQHEVILATLRQKHEEDMLHLKEKFDDTKKELNWKTEDVNRLQDEVQLANRMTDQAKIEAADTINKLTRSLEQSQRHCREILEEGSANGIGELKYELKHVVKEKCQLEEQCKEMMDELRDTKEQLKMYEAALDSSTKGPTSSTPYNDNPMEMKWPSHDSFKTPLSRFRNQASVTESPVYSLRDELIKALANNRAKRDELHNAKAKSDVLERQLDAANQKLDQLNTENETLKKTANSNSETKDQDEEAVSTQLQEKTEMISNLQTQMQNFEDKISELQNECDQKRNDNCQLKTKIAELMQQFDKDKIDALRNCEKTFMQFNEDSKNSLEQRLKIAHSQEVESLREEIKGLNKELLEVKDSYVSIADENKLIAEHVRSESEREAEERLKELKHNLEEEHKESLAKLEEALLNKHHLVLENEVKKLKSEKEEEMKHRIETEIALAKVDWFASYEDEKSAAIERAVENAKANWTKERTIDDSSNIQEMFKQLREEWETVKQNEFDQRLTAAVKMAKGEWQETVKVDQENAITRAVDDCNRKNQIAMQKEVEEAVYKAKECWEKDVRRIKENLNVTVQEMERLMLENDQLQTDSNKLKAEINKMEIELKDKFTEINKSKNSDVDFAVAQAKAEWKKERDLLRRQILQEESQRIRSELLTSFAEINLQEFACKERSIVDDAVEKNYLDELRETIAFIKQSYEKRIAENKASAGVALARAKDNWAAEEKKRTVQILKEEKAKLEEEFEKEKARIVTTADNRVQEEVAKMERRLQDKSKHELDRMKSEWKNELQSLQEEHVKALRGAVKDVKLTNEKETEGLRKQFNEYIRKIKGEHSEKLEKQKADLSAYHNNLTKRTLELARKEWELETSFRGRYPDRKLKRAFSESSHHNDKQQSYTKQETAFETVQLESSDSGFTSPFSKTTQSNNMALNHRRNDVSQTSHSNNMEQFSHPYEKMLEKFEANILHLKDAKPFTKDANELANKSTQTDDNSEDNEAILQDMRGYYLETVRRIHDDVLKHISKTKENAAANLRKEILKEKKALISKIRKLSIKNLKGSQSNSSVDSKKSAVFAALKELEFEDIEKDEPTKGGNDNYLNSNGNPSTSNTHNEKLHSPEVFNPITVKFSPILPSSSTAKRPTKVSRNPTTTRRESSPSNSMFSCESNATFYTELPSSLNATPGDEHSRMSTQSSAFCSASKHD